MGFVVKGLQHHWSLENYVIEPPPGEARPITVTADSVHVVSSCGWAKVSGLRVRLNQDDIMNFHDKATVVRRVGPRRLAFVHHRANAYFGAKAGTQVELRQANYAPTGLHANVLAARPLKAAFSLPSLCGTVPDLPLGAMLIAPGNGRTLKQEGRLCEGSSSQLMVPRIAGTAFANLWYNARHATDTDRHREL